MNVLIVEDESHTAALLQELIEEDSDFIVTDKVESIVEAVQYLSKRQQNIDLLFLDIQLADGPSFEIFKHIDVVVPVVFCTAYDEFTLQAIKHNGIDYVLKPFKEEEIHHTLQKYKRLLANLQTKAMSPMMFHPPEIKQYQQSFLTQFREKTIIKLVDEVALFAVENEIVYLYSHTGEKYAMSNKMESIETSCDPNQFFRINRQMLINRTAIRSFEPYFNRKIILELSVKLSDNPVVSRLKVSAFKDWLQQ